MKATLIILDGWMNYKLHIKGEKKPRRVYWRNHNRSYIRRDGCFEPVYILPGCKDGDLFDGGFDLDHEFIWTVDDHVFKRITEENT